MYYTNDCGGTDLTPLVKYSDDSAILDLSNSDSIYFGEIERFNTWCKDNFLDLNTKKTKEMLIEFINRPVITPDFCIDGVQVERVDEYKYLGTVIDQRLNFNANTESVHKKCQPRVYCLQKLRSLDVIPMILCIF